LVHRRIEIHDSRQVHNDVDFALEMLNVLLRNTAEWFCDIALDDVHLLPYRALPSGALDDDAERRRFQDFGIESLRAAHALLPAHLNDEMFEFRKAIEDHRQQDFADETGTTDHQHRAVAEGVDG